MKKLVLTTVCALSMAGAAFAQGTLVWTSFNANFIGQTNTSPSALFGGSGTGGVSGNTLGGGLGANNSTLYYYELLYNTSFNGSQVAVPNAAQLFGGSWLDVGLTATNGANPNGRINPANNEVTTAPTPSTWNNGTTNNIILVGWSADLGTSWLSVSNILAAAALGNLNPLIAQVGTSAAYFGESATGYLNPGPTGSPGPTVFSTSVNANGLPINGSSGNMEMYLIPVPEPTSLALAGLGGLSLLLFRRQRK
jgi:hypothetical protein